MEKTSKYIDEYTKYNIPKYVVLKKNVNLKKYNTFRVCSKAKYFFIPENIEGFSAITNYFNKKSIKYVILGGGSNVLFLDEIVEIPIIYTGFFNRTEKTENGILAYAGAKTSEVSEYALKNSLTGLEFLYGLPGTVGGATYMNARCYGNSVSDFIKKIGIIDEDGEYRHLDIADCDYSYKQSIFQKKSYTIIDVLFNLQGGQKKEISKKMKEYKKDRVEKHQYDYPSAGCIFLNDRETNLIAGQLIDSLGLKGIKEGGAMVSPYHANFIVNYKNAKGREIYSLIEFIKRSIYDKTAITLKTEVKIIGGNHEQ